MLVIALLRGINFNGENQRSGIRNSVFCLATLTNFSLIFLLYKKKYPFCCLTRFYFLLDIESFGNVSKRTNHWRMQKILLFYYSNAEFKPWLVFWVCMRVCLQLLRLYNNQYSFSFVTLWLDQWWGAWHCEALLLKSSMPELLFSAIETLY